MINNQEYICNMAVCKAQDAKDKKNSLLGATKNIKGKKFRIYSLFSIVIK